MHSEKKSEVRRHAMDQWKSLPGDIILQETTKEMKEKRNS